MAMDKVKSIWKRLEPTDTFLVNGHAWGIAWWDDGFGVFMNGRMKSWSKTRAEAEREMTDFFSIEAHLARSGYYIRRAG